MISDPWKNYFCYLSHCSSCSCENTFKTFERTQQVNSLMRVHYKKLTMKFGYLCDTKHFKITAGIMTDNIPGHIGFLGLLYNFWNTYI